MEIVSTPEPHFIPGYTGHCPQYLYRVGKTYGNLTHKLLIDPCIHHSAKLLVAGPNEIKTAGDKPTLKEIDLIKTHEREGDAVLKYPIIPGYNGFIPNINSKIGLRFLAAATAGVAEHERYMQQLKCERRNLRHKNLLQSGEGLFGRNLGEISMHQTTYQLPLLPVRKEAEGIKRTREDSYQDKRVPYSKHTPPHFMVDNDPEKFVMKGYAGHIPMTLNRFGESNKPLTANALCEFSNDYQHRKTSDWESTDNKASSGESFKIYHSKTGMIPNYAGHVPGEIFKFGSTYGKNTIDAKRWLEDH
ncbi:UPF0605 protein CG18335 [Episyrphus balteatus]|uniref:UPF0605 protein CG18335 n=1 Tax=Episyrphus balteatus TaxID=286459 RepID=UPI0024858A65|nr:UPF0605 protein CG18335 [Episyrphus balteatus]